MNALVFLLPVALFLGAVFVVLFIVAVKNGQFDDLDDPPERILHED
ncbi:MAG: cbb3-type cytochrome oxidase assembly protein CcoS [Gemmatimonadota bacterium]